MNNIVETILDAITEELEYYKYIRDDNIDIGCYYDDYTHGVFQGQVQAAERIKSKVLKIIETTSDKEDL